MPGIGKSEMSQRDPAAEEYLHKIAQKLTALLPPGYGFALFVTQLGEGGNMFYASSIDRQDVARAITPWVRKVLGDATTSRDNCEDTGK